MVQQSKPSARREGLRVKKHGLFMGTDVVNNTPLYLLLKWLATHLHVIGPTGSGKSRFLLWLFSILMYLGRPIIVIDPKGGLYTLCRDWAIANGFGKRLVLFDMSKDASMLPGYNPLRPNGLSISMQSKWIREGIRSAWGQDSFDATPQLMRFLFLTLFVARALELTLSEALDVLRPKSGLRKRALPLLKRAHPLIHDLLWYFDTLSERRKDELGASTLARLEGFVIDDVIAPIITSASSIDPEQVIRGNMILLVNFAKYQPVLPDDLKLFGRMFFQDILAHAYKLHGEGVLNEHKPLYVICDEVQNFATRQLCDALDEGRGIGFHTILAHQHLEQLADEESSGYLLHSIMNDARTKVVFGGLAYEQLESLSKNLLLDFYDPWRLKDEIRTPLFAPVLTEWESITSGTSRTTTRGESYPESESEGESFTTSEGENESVSAGTTHGDTVSESDTVAHGDTVGQSTADSHTRQRSVTEAVGTHSAQSYGRAQGAGSSYGAVRGTHAGLGESQVYLPTGEGGAMTVLETSGLSSMGSENFSSSEVDSYADVEGASRMHALTEGTASTYADAQQRSRSDIAAHTSGRSVSTNVNESTTRGRNRNHSRGATKSRTRGKTPSWSESVATSESVTSSPAYEYEEREIVSSRTYLTPEEQDRLAIRTLMNLPQRTAVLKTPGSQAVFFTTPFVSDPRLSRKALAAALGRIYAALPFYFPRPTPESEGAPLTQVTAVLIDDDDPRSYFS
jgi:hypothetical protein